MMPATGGHVVTVLGPVAAEHLGHVQPHEHLLSDLSSILEGRPPEAIAALVGIDAGIAPETWLHHVHEPVRLDNRYWVARRFANVDNLRLDDRATAIEEVARFVHAGGGTIVDATSEGIGRDPAGLAAIARATGAHIVMGAGYYVHDYHPAALATRSTAQIADAIVTDALEGVGGTGVRAGIIGEIGLSFPVHPVEDRVLAAAVAAAAATGLAIQVHPGRDPRSPLDAIRRIEAMGGDPSRVIVSHVDRTLTEPAQRIELARTGCYLEFDMFGQESCYYPLAPVELPNDATRVQHLGDLLAAGHDRLLVSSDVCQKVHLTRYGGWGLTHVLDSVVPLMRTKGLSSSEIDLITRRNPAAVLTVRDV